MAVEQQSRAGETGRSALRKIVIVFKTHFDLGFTALPAEVMALYTGPFFEGVRRTIEATANEPEHLRYKWTLPAWPLKFLLHDLSVPEETRLAARSLVESGNLTWHAYPFTTHTAFCSLEELVRGLHISRSLSEEFGRWPIAAKQTDVPGHTWALPSLLCAAGIKFLHLGCNAGSHAPHVPRLFWWEGPDGARLLTYYSPLGYGTPLLPPDDWPFDTWLALQQTVDNIGPHQPEELAHMRREIEEGAPGAEFVFGSLDDFAESLLNHPEQLADLPVVPYDLADTWIHGIGTMPREVARARHIREGLLALELDSVRFSWPTSTYGRAPLTTNPDFALAHEIAPLVDAAYEQLLLFSEHTWGLDVKSTIERVFGDSFAAARQTEPYKRLESSWQAKAAYVDKAWEYVEQAKDIVRTAVRPAMAREKGREPMSAQEHREWNQRNGGTVYDLSDNVLENKYLRLEVAAATGAIVSLMEKRTGRDWVDRSSAEPFAGYRYDLYSARDIAEFLRAYGTFFQDWFVNDFGKTGYPLESEHITAYARNFTLSRQEDERNVPCILLSGGTLEVATANGRVQPLPSQSISIRIVLNGSYVQIYYGVANKEATPLAESTVVPLPLNLPKPRYRLGQTGSVINPVYDIAEGANHSLWCVDWVEASDGRDTLNIVPSSMPLVSIGNTGIYRFEPQRVVTEPLVYAHLSNTQWGTNFPQWLRGDFEWLVQLVFYSDNLRPEAHGQCWKTATLSVFDEAYSRFVEHILSPGMQIQSARPLGDGRSLLVRCWETVGKARPRNYFIIRTEPPIASVWRCDLMERPVEKLEMRQSKGKGETWVYMDVKPYALETLLIEFAELQQEGGETGASE